MSETQSQYPTNLELKVARLPTKPGVYLHRDANGNIIYVGKAKNLRARVRAYFQEARTVDAKTKALQRKISDVDVIVTDTEAEALLLENNLIKEHQPRYNILLKDDKSYPYICITKEEYPKVLKTRRVVRDGSKYFGPYTDGTYLYYLLKALRSIFPLRSCDLPLTDKTIAAGKYKVCLDYHIKRCDGPCEGFITREQYNSYIRQAQQILTGRTRELEHQLEERMVWLANEMRFEDAAIVRERLTKLREYTAKQKVMSSDSIDRDVFALSRAGKLACSIVFTIREGNLVGKRHFFVNIESDVADSAILLRTIEMWYADNDQLPHEILLPFDVDGVEVIRDYLSVRASQKVEIVVPQIGDKRKLLTLAETNADYLLREHVSLQVQREQSVPYDLLSLQKDLVLEELPQRIECFDNSHMQGNEYVSSMVVFVNGKAKKSEYRTFKLQQTSNDDFAAMREVMSRRYGGSLKDTPLPDLCIIDGGKGQVSAAIEALTALQLDASFPVVGLAKRLEEVVLPNNAESIILPRASGSLRLLQRIRDEAHRVAISYHRKLRSKRTLQTELMQIKGVGNTTATNLLVRLGSVEAVKGASVAVLEEIVGKTLAEKIYKHYHS